MKHFAVLPLSASLTGALGGILQFRSPLDGTITQVVVIVGTANGNGDTIFDVNVEGDSIFTEETRPTIAEGGTADFAVSLTAEVSEGDLITVDADTVPAGGFPAKSLTVLITIDDGLTLPIFSASALTPRQVYAFDPLTGALAPADAVLTHDAVIFDLYYGALARVPTTLELSAARTSLLTGMQAGSAALLLALRTLGHALFTSAEYIARARTDAQFVQDLYFAYLGRDSDGAGQTAWEAVLTGGATRSDVDEDFSEGTELSNIRFPRVSGAGASILRGANPMTTAGDIIVGGSGGGETRVAKPAANKVWGTDSGGALGYKDDPASGSGPVAPFDSTHPDAVPASPNALDDEFGGGSLDAKWVWANADAQVTSGVANGAFWIKSSATGANAHVARVQPFTPGSAYKIRMKVSVPRQRTNCSGGLIIRNSTTGRIHGLYFTGGGDPVIVAVSFQSPSTNTTHSTISAPQMSGYFEIEEDATTRYFRYSVDGRTFDEFYNTPKSTFTPDQCGMALYAWAGAMTMSVEWFRRIN